ncbi:unnamed protein product [Moneuplotes crassus]|uniref:SANT domain-containing protein n=1 Tax=Euplotes crassus TaxID=5936 RepID=A0AAD1US54_EUPCR|nr:unnamed protein product [Moneuplotes crassus]
MRSGIVRSVRHEDDLWIGLFRCGCGGGRCVLSVWEVERFSERLGGGEYQVKNKLDFGIFEPSWTAADEIKLLEAVAKSGIDNWFEAHMKYLPHKSPEEIEAHFYAFYDFNKPQEEMSTQNYKNISEQCIGPLCLTQDSLNREIVSLKEGEVQYNEELSKQNEEIKLALLERINQRQKRIFGCDLSQTLYKRSTETVEEINEREAPIDEEEFYSEFNSLIGYNKKRGSFDVEFDEEVECKREKNQTLRKEIEGYNETELEIVHKLNPLRPFLQKEEFEDIKEGYLEEANLAHRIEQLKILRNEGFETIQEVEQALKSMQK